MRLDLRKSAAALCLFGLSLPVAAFSARAAEKQSLTVLHFSDYHSHAMPFYSEGRPNQAGVARAIGFLRSIKKANPEAIVLNGGDTLGPRSRAISDKYRCVEWPWFNGLVDAMAMGNHELDYGAKVFQGCRRGSRPPILSANLVFKKTQKPFLAVEGKPFLILKRGGLKIGIFALSGADFSSLILPENMPAGTGFGDAVSAAKFVVEQLKKENVNAIVKLGHSSYEEDVALAKAIPGITLILGSHSHKKQELTKIPGTETWFISPYQYLTYFSQVELQFENGKLSDVNGKLIRMDESVAEAGDIKKKVEQLQKTLENDPAYASRFVKIGTATGDLSNDPVESSETALGNFVMDVVRKKTGAHFAISTSSSFRSAIPEGEITEEVLTEALPFRNFVITAEMSGKQVKDLVQVILTKHASDAFSQQSGARIRSKAGKARDIELLSDPKDESKGFSEVVDERLYKVATTDFQADVAKDYRPIFSSLKNKTRTDFVVNDLVTEFIRKNSPISGKLDGRYKFED